MTHDEIVDLLRRYQSAIEQHDGGVQAAFYTPNGVREGPAFGAVSGRTAIAKRYDYWFTAFPDLALDLQETIIEGDRAAVSWTFSGQQQGL